MYVMYQTTRVVAIYFKFHAGQCLKCAQCHVMPQYGRLHILGRARHCTTVESVDDRKIREDGMQKRKSKFEFNQSEVFVELDAQFMADPTFLHVHPS